MTHISRLAIVNRGEAARRLVRTVRDLNLARSRKIEVVALATPVDAEAPFAREADWVAPLTVPKGKSAAAAYLDAEALIRVLKDIGADAIWVGWGFLSEDASFNAKVRAAGITFIGPSPEAMQLTGDKVSAKRLAERVGIPVVPWSNEPVATLDEALEVATRLSYPVALKAAAGGGGRGIRVVDNAHELPRAFETARSEAEKAFGDGRLFIERCVVRARHLEVQVLGDLHGDAVALGLRDCTIQRRHQKLIEESPGPIATRELTERLCGYAVQFTRAAGYANAGTVEFIYDDERQEPYFMEMNARLQVEHPVTELLYGVDLVREQLAIAEGKSVKDLVLAPRGAAIEVRLNAEDPDNDFAPSPGRVRRFDVPQGPGVRVDAGVVQGSLISPDFDSMIAKVIAYGENRQEALARLRRALADTAVLIEGGATNKTLLTQILSHDDFLHGRIATRWLDQERARGAFKEPPFASEALLAAAVLAYRSMGERILKNFFAAVARGVPQNLPLPEGRDIRLSSGSTRVNVNVECNAFRTYLVRFADGPVVRAQFYEDGPGAALLVVGERRLRVLFQASEHDYQLEVEGIAHRVTLDAGGVVRAPAPSLVMDIAVQEGDEVKPGQRLFSLEAMKMETAVRASEPGRVTRVLVQPNMQVAAGQALLMLAPLKAEGTDANANTHVALTPTADAFADLFDANGLPRGGALLQPNANEAIASELTRFFLGYDISDDRLDKLQALLDSTTSWERVTSPQRFSSLGNLVVLFVDVARLFAGKLTRPSGQTITTSLAFYTYARTLDRAGEGFSQAFRTTLQRALAHYAVQDLAPTPMLRHAVARLAATQGQTDRAARRQRLISSLMRALLQLYKAGTDFTQVAGLEQALNELPLVSDARHPYVADNAYQTRYVLFLQSRFERRASEVSAHVHASFDALPALRGQEYRDAVMELANTTEAIIDLVAPMAWSKELLVRLAAAEVLYRRLYVAAVQELRIEALDASTTVGTASLSNNRRGIVILRADANIDAALTQFEQLPAAPAGEPYVLDLVFNAKDAQAIADAVAARLAHSPRLAGALRVAVIAAAPGQPMDVVTLELKGANATTRPELRGLHPEVVERVQLSRLSSFELSRLPTREGVMVFAGRAKENPRDQRVFVVAEVRDTTGQPLSYNSDSRRSFEHAFFEAARALRETLAARPAKERTFWNRIVLHVRPLVVLDREDITEVVRSLWPHMEGLGLEALVVRARLTPRSRPETTPSDVHIRVAPSGTGLEFQITPPRTTPLAAATPYELKVQRARALDVPYPYEIIRFLTGSENRVALSDSKPLQGRFEEFDLHPDTGRAVPVSSRTPGENTCGVVFGVISHVTDKYPEGMERVLVLSDPTRGMGALAEPECARLIAAIDLAESRGVPLEWVPVSSGAKISMDSGTENLDWTARVLKRIIAFTQVGGEINVIVDGVNVGAQSYFNAEATMLMHTRGVLIMTPRGAMVLTGKRALEYSGGVSAEDERGIGGLERIMGPNGQAQYFARDLANAFELLLLHYRFTYKRKGEPRVRRAVTQDPASRDVASAPYPTTAEAPFNTLGDVFSATHNAERKKPFAIRAVMDAVMDQDGGRIERFVNMLHAETAVVRECHLGGHAVCMIGIESQQQPRSGYVPGDGPDGWTGGTLFPLSSKKVARAISQASGNRPVVVLANLSGFDGSPESLRKLQLEYGAEIGRAVVNFQGPLIFCVISRYHGGAYVVFSKVLNDNLYTMALEGSYASVIGGAPAAAVVFAGEVRAETQNDPRVAAARDRLKASPREEHPHLREELARVTAQVLAEKQGELAAKFDKVHSVERAKAVGSLDEIVNIRALRERLIERLES